MDKHISKIERAATILPIRTTVGFSRVCRAQSKIYPVEGDGRLSAARFMKEAAREKLLALGFKPEYLKSIT
jgi:hypothetical protein